MKKIMFADEYGLTAAVLNGTKKQTRRFVPSKLLLKYGHNKHNNKSDDLIRDAPFKVGDKVAVAQRYCDIYDSYLKGRLDAINSATICLAPGWSNKMFVKAELMPNNIIVEDIRVERLQDISDDDCLAEGVMRGDFTNTRDKFYIDLHGDCVAHITFATAREAYASLIDRISGRGVWNKNPWVYAIKFA